MKKLFFLIFILLAQFAVGQKTYKVTEGELLFIHPKEGVILKKGNEYINLFIYPQLKNHKLTFTTKTDNVSDEDFKTLMSNPNNVYSEEILKNYSFKKLKKLKFVSDEKDKYGKYEFFQYNNEVFTSYQFERNDSLKTKKLIECDEYSPHCYVDFGNEKKIVFVFDSPKSFLIPTKKEVILFSDFHYRKYKIEKKEKHLSNLQHYHFTERIHKEKIYHIDTLKNGKLKLKNYFNECVLNKVFDSIHLGRFIIGYNDSDIWVYNYTFKEFKTPNIRAAFPDKFYPILEIIQENELKKINLSGSKYTGKDGPWSVNLDHYFPTQYVDLKVIKKEESFYLITSYLYDITNRSYPFFDYDEIKLYHTSETETFEYSGTEFNRLVTNSEIMHYWIKKPIVLYTKLKNGNYNINTIDYFLTQYTTPEIFAENNIFPSNLDSVKRISPSLFKIEKNGLQTYYPLVKEIKYKFLGDFVYDSQFARFELPNGQKGWLSIDGKEYLDK